MVFSFAFAINFAYANYVKNVTRSKWLKAAALGEVVTILMFCNIANYVENNWYIIPVVIGGFMGTYLNQRLN